MAKDNYIIIDNFKNGWHKRVDASRVPLGGAIKSVNINITDRGGIAPRGGELLIGTASSASTGVHSLYSFKRADGTAVLIKGYAGTLELLSNNTNDWSLIKNGYTTGKPFGFSEHAINVDQVDLLYLGNAYEAYSRWEGWESQLNGALVGAETAVIVDTVLLPTVSWSGTASSCTTTTITVPAGTWATDIWNDFYVHITDGAKNTFISKITATSATQITFDAISGLSGTPAFEIRQLAVPATGTIVYNGSSVAYTAVPQSDRFTVASAHAGSDNDPITVAPTEYNANPRGNLFDTLFGDMYVAGIKSAPHTVQRSATIDATDFTKSAPRSADEGDDIYFPYGGFGIADIKSQEDGIYVIKPDAIEQLVYTKDSSDIATITPILKGVSVGSKSRAWRMGDDIVFATPDNKITSIGRVKLKDSRPQINDIAYPIRREVKDYDMSSVRGTEFINRGYVTCKSSSSAVGNNRVLVYNKDYDSWEGYWTVNAGVLVEHNGDLYYGDSYSPNVYKLNTGLNKVKGSDSFGITAEWQSGFINRRGTGFYLEEVSALAVEGYITSGTTINFDLYKDFAKVPFESLSIAGTETEYQDNLPIFSLLGGSPLGLEPLGASAVVGDEDSDGRRHFIAFLYFEQTQVEYISVGVRSSGENQSWEIIALGINALENVFTNQPKIKNT